MAAAVRFAFAPGGALSSYRTIFSDHQPAGSLKENFSDKRVLIFVGAWFAFNLLFAFGVSYPEARRWPGRPISACRRPATVSLFDQSRADAGPEPVSTAKVGVHGARCALASHCDADHPLSGSFPEKAPPAGGSLDPPARRMRLCP